jgi:hypothetical protein
MSLQNIKWQAFGLEARNSPLGALVEITYLPEHGTIHAKVAFENTVGGELRVAFPEPIFHKDIPDMLLAADLFHKSGVPPEQAYKEELAKAVGNWGLVLVSVQGDNVIFTLRLGNFKSVIMRSSDEVSDFFATGITERRDMVIIVTGIPYSVSLPAPRMGTKFSLEEDERFSEGQYEVVDVGETVTRGTRFTFVNVKRVGNIPKKAQPLKVHVVGE